MIITNSMGARGLCDVIGHQLVFLCGKFGSDLEGPVSESYVCGSKAGPFNSIKKRINVLTLPSPNLKMKFYMISLVFMT